MNGIDVIVYIAILFMVCLAIYAYLEGWFSKRPKSVEENDDRYRIVAIKYQGTDLYRVEKYYNLSWHYANTCAFMHEAESWIDEQRNPTYNILKEY